MKRITLILLMLSQLVMAEEPLPFKYPLDTISFQITSRQWVSTESAVLGVTVHMTLNSMDLIKARADLMNRLNQIAKADWHVTEFNRSQDNSGLETLFVQAEARVPQAVLTDVYKHAKTLSVAGARYEIAKIDFKPSLEEVQQSKTSLRERLYQQVVEELARINKTYPEQKYSLSRLVFSEGETVFQQPKGYEAKVMNAEMMATPTPIAVSNELLLTALVEAASNRHGAP